MNKLTKIKDLYIGDAPWGLALDQQRQLAYVFSDAYIGGFDNKITCIGFINGEYKILNSKILVEPSDSMAVNPRSGLLYFSYVSGSDFDYGVRIIDPNNDYLKVGFISIPLQEEVEYNSMFENIIFDEGTQQLFIATGPQATGGPLGYPKGSFSIIQCDARQNKYVQSVDNYVNDNTDLSTDNSGLGMFGSEFIFFANPSYGSITTYNIKNNQVFLYRNIQANNRLYIPWDVAVDYGNKKLYVAIQSSDSVGLWRLGITDTGLGTKGEFLRLPSELGQFNIILDGKNNSIFAIPDNDLEGDKRGNLVIFDLVTLRSYVTDISAQADSVVFDEKNRRLYIADETTGFLSIFSVD
ncbi:hypothetical protein GRAQ_01726 [Rahnella aquatilis CIP 78.65 = ATCC 33071]|jgi:hypothetical protein|uniref:Gluconolactonase n=1 Tax=Rahnella aquatilis (strain ATCC 33071 / DSM 4594 / JCM 1683 / NBRC 105701 / NCIMB 13365 / CIP 78.65) TaxID=745277 RepID=H2IRM4_RAHAC|nr:hypothetical protein [Rahnella aquatilis]AEX52525.1 hypothetical protein Rahaq2_2681 [Rahnella aquatilis CIP 78.65 = ATCC 33071]KFD06642.1 hypothetical protein GRAQ_01726 [Rahnella aquatilis CIP 78.65 = ATCC 33071]